MEHDDLWLSDSPARSRRSWIVAPVSLLAFVLLLFLFFMWPAPGRAWWVAWRDTATPTPEWQATVDSQQTQIAFLFAQQTGTTTATSTGDETSTATYTPTPILPTPTSTQTPALSGRLEGTVTDRVGSPVINLSVGIRNGPATIADKDGVFVLSNLPVGDQLIVVEPPSGRGQLTQYIRIEPDRTTHTKIVYDAVTSQLGLLSIISPVDDSTLTMRKDGDVHRATVYGRNDGLQEILGEFEVWVLVSSERDERLWVQHPPALNDPSTNTWKADIILGSQENPPEDGERWDIIAVAASVDSGINRIANTPRLSLLPSHISSNVVTVETDVAANSQALSFAVRPAPSQNTYFIQGPNVDGFPVGELLVVYAQDPSGLEFDVAMMYVIDKNSDNVIAKVIFQNPDVVIASLSALRVDDEIDTVNLEQMETVGDSYVGFVLTNNQIRISPTSHLKPGDTLQVVELTVGGDTIPTAQNLLVNNLGTEGTVASATLIGDVSWPPKGTLLTFVTNN